jgi:hypothetical protein
MGKWLKKFSERARVTTDSVDILYTMLTLSVSNQTHSEGFSLPLSDGDDPDGPCPAWSSGQWWQLPRQAWHCRACEPNLPLTATTLTLPALP